MQESHAVLVVEFTGPSVSDGTLCTDRLAPSLLALSDALRFLNRLVNPDGVEAGLSVTKAEGGRFELGLWVCARSRTRSPVSPTASSTRSPAPPAFSPTVSSRSLPSRSGSRAARTPPLRSIPRSGVLK